MSFLERNDIYVSSLGGKIGHLNKEWKRRKTTCIIYIIQMALHWKINVAIGIQQ